LLAVRQQKKALAAVAVIGSLIIFTLRVNRTVAQTDVAHH
ncbi:hypothetical protein PQ659_29345, partial [Escherichia coli]